MCHDEWTLEVLLDTADGVELGGATAGCREPGAESALLARVQALFRPMSFSLFHSKCQPVHRAASALADFSLDFTTFSNWAVRLAVDGATL